MKTNGAARSLKINLGTRKAHIAAEADWITLYKDSEPEAKIFYTWYRLEKTDSDKAPKHRPVTFVFNGGPGASSVYLHLGAIGPRRIELTDEGYPLPPPNALADNEESWLSFTDLVFVDPVGTGFSYAGPAVRRETAGASADRSSDEAGKSGKAADKNANASTKAGSPKPDDAAKEDGTPYYTIKEDLASLGQFMSRFLTKAELWETAVFIAGESYGGFRAAKMTRTLQKDWGIPLAGSVMISPALEFGLLSGSDYDAQHFLDTFPSFAAAAAFHGRAKARKDGESIPEFSRRAAAFALHELFPVLAGGTIVDEKIRSRVLRAASDFTGMSRDYLAMTGGRIPVRHFIRALLADRHLLVGIYDASYRQPDPFPDRPVSEGPEPTLDVIDRVFSAGINHHLRSVLGVDTDREYRLLSGDVFKNWKVDTQSSVLDLQVGATDDLRFGLALNRDTRAFICHGYYDLRTPWFSTERIAALMKLPESDRERLTLRYYDGGHMFYSWKSSRRAFFEDIEAFYAAAPGRNESRNADTPTED